MLEEVRPGKVCIMTNDGQNKVYKHPMSILKKKILQHLQRCLPGHFFWFFKQILVET